jgi:hypothetical protein
MTSRTDWKWFGDCDTCEAVPGGACLDQRNRLTATIRGQKPLARPHAGRTKLADRLIPFLSEEARAAVPEIVSYLATVATFGAEWGARGRPDLLEAVHVLTVAAAEDVTTE